MANSTSTFTTTSSSEALNKALYADWIIPITFNSIFIACGIWTLYSLVHYGVRKNKWKISPQGHVKSLSSGSVYIAVVLCNCTALLYFVAAMVTFNVGFQRNEDLICNVLRKVASVIYFLFLFSISYLLWIRQRFLYSNPLLNSKFNVATKAFSWLSIFIIFIGGTLAIIFFNLPYDNVSTPRGCAYRETGEGRSVSVIVGIGIIIFGKIALLGLLIYPLHKNKFRPTMKSTGDKNEQQKSSGNGIAKQSRSVIVKTLSKFPSASPTTSSSKDSSILVNRAIKKTIFFAVMSLVCDSLTFLVPIFLYRINPLTRLGIFVGIIDVFLNLGFAIFSFASWKKMLSSPFRIFFSSVDSAIISSA